MIKRLVPGLPRASPLHCGLLHAGKLNGYGKVPLGLLALSIEIIRTVATVFYSLFWVRCGGSRWDCDCIPALFCG